MPDASIIRSNLSFSWPDGPPVFEERTRARWEGALQRSTPTSPISPRVRSSWLRLSEGRLRETGAPAHV